MTHESSAALVEYMEAGFKFEKYTTLLGADGDYWMVLLPPDQQGRVRWLTEYDPVWNADLPAKFVDLEYAVQAVIARDQNRNQR